MNRREFIESAAAAASAAHGIILSRKYSEMKLDHLRAAGRAIRESVRTVAG